MNVINGFGRKETAQLMERFVRGQFTCEHEITVRWVPRGGPAAGYETPDMFTTMHGWAWALWLTGASYDTTSPERFLDMLLYHHRVACAQVPE